MNRVSIANASGFGIVVALTALATRPTARLKPPAAYQIAAPVSRAQLVDGGKAVADAAGHPVPLRPYRRIASTSLLTDRLLHELCEPDRIVAFSAVGVRTSPWAYQYAGKPSTEGVDAVESLIALQPDLVLMNRFGGPGQVGKLRAAGIEVFDLGELHGLASVLAAADTVGHLIGHPERGEQFARSLELRMRRVAANLGDRPRRRAVYVAVAGTHIFGGTVGTSYHDVLDAAGLIDAAAQQFRDWPDYTAEQLLAMAPDLVVTKVGAASKLCAYPGVDRLAACQDPTHIIEMPAGLLDEPGPTMLDAAEMLYDRAYPVRN